MPVFLPPAAPENALNVPGLAEVLLNSSPAGIMLLRPLYAADGKEITDFGWGPLNAAAQQMLGLPAQPTGSFLTLFPTAGQQGVFGFYRDAFVSGEVAQRQQLYQHDGLDGYYALVAQRHADMLVVSFTDANDQPRTAVEEALRASQAREQAAHAEAEAERATLQNTLEQAPVAIAILAGPSHVITFANTEMALIWGRSPASLLGQPHFEALPDLTGQGFEAIFADVYHTGQPCHLQELAVDVDRLGHGHPIRGYFNIVYQPLRDARNDITGIVASAVEVTEQVLARQQVQQLNQELEALVLARTQALRHAHAATEHQREQLYQVFEQTPVAIAILRGANLRIELANPAVAAIWGREPGQVLGRPYFEAVPETTGQGFEQLLANVLATGQPATITEAPVMLARAHTGQPAQAYVNFAFQPLRDAEGNVTGLVASGTEVTEQVLARQQVQQLNEELKAGNEALEDRVQVRTRQVEQSRLTAERQQNELARVFEQAPVAIAVYRGPSYIIELANPMVCQLWGRTRELIIGKGLFEALPEVAGMGFEELLDQVMATGEPCVAHAMPAVHERDGRRDTVYWDFVYVPMYEDDGRIYGVMVVATEVTEQVLARQQVQQLNDELETRVAARTAETQAALREAQDQREQLREQQNLLHQILGQVPASLATLNGPGHRFTFFNDQYQALSAGRVELGLTVAEVFPEVVEQGFVALLDQVYATGEPFIGKDVPIQLLRSGTGQPGQHYVDFIYQPLRDGQGRIQGILAFIIDTTEAVLARRQADTLQAAALAAVQRRAQQRQELYQIFAQTPVAIVLLREPDHRIDYFNPAFEELFPPEEWAGPLQGHRLDEVYPRIELAGLVGLLDRVFETGETQVVIDMPLADLQPGSPRYVTLSYQAYREEGHIVGVAAFAYDVTEQVLGRREAETMQAELLAGAQRRAQARQDLLNLFEHAPVAVVLLREPNHRIEYYNQSFEELYPGENLRGRTLCAAYPFMDTSAMLKHLDRVYQTGETYVGLEDLLPTTAPGPPRYISFTYQAYREDDRIAGVAVFIYEVTEQVLARQQVQRLNEELATINEEVQATNQELHDSNARLTRTNADLDTFVYSASHDLKSPITNIEGLLLALRQQLPAEAQAAPLVPRLLEMMDGAVARFQETLGHLTDVTRLHQAQADQPAEAVDVPALAEAVRLDILPELTAAGATLTVDLAGCRAVFFPPKNLRSIL
ncbi:MAG: PAS domain-containing protein [Bacteroidota bacterium]|nr:PAS domain-containing protein [Bacteroidota bacterium]